MARIAFKGCLTCGGRVENEIDGMRVRAGAMSPNDRRSVSFQHSGLQRNSR